MLQEEEEEEEEAKMEPRPQAKVHRCARAPRSHRYKF